MAKAQAPSENKIPGNSIQLIRWEGSAAITQEEAEARLHQEGYESFNWYDVPGARYPNHRHNCDECIWVLKGEIQFKIENETYVLKAGDKIYLPAGTQHETQIPLHKSATYVVGQK